MSNLSKQPPIRFKEFTSDWPQARLGEIASFAKGKGISKADIDPNGRTPCVRYGELYTTYNELIDEVKSFTRIPVTELVLSQKNDVIIPASGETALDIATASCILREGIALSGDLNIIRSELDGVFLSYQLNNAKRHELARLAQGSSVIHLYPDHLKKTRVSTPTLQEQQKIAAFLSKVDEKIALLTEKKDKLTEYKRGVMQQLFNGRWETDESEPSRTTFIPPTLRFKADDGSEFPDWEEKRLGDVFAERSDRGGFEELLSVSVKNGVTLQSDSDRRDSSSSDKSNYKTVHAGDIVYNSMRMWQGASGVSEFNGIVSPAYTILAKNDFNSSAFYAYYFKLTPVIQTFQRNSQGLTSDTWNLKYQPLSRIKMITPSLDEQNKIVRFLSAVDRKIELNGVELASAKKWKKGLLQQMFV